MVEIDRELWRSTGQTPTQTGTPRAGLFHPELVKSPGRRPHSLSGQPMPELSHQI